jgi:hypothetical protein
MATPRYIGHKNAITHSPRVTGGDRAQRHLLAGPDRMLPERRRTSREASPRRRQARPIPGKLGLP